jgi:hypothetical protein
MHMPFYFNHIPKTAGTSFRHSLERVFSPSKVNKHWFIEDYLRETNDRLESYQLLSGHFGAYPISLHPKSLNVLSFFRDPVKRTFSHFLHIQNDKSHPFNGEVASMSFSDFINSEISEFELLSFQTRFTGLTSLKDHLFLVSRKSDRNALIHKLRSKSVLQQALDQLSRIYFIGITEQYELSVNQLSLQLRIPLENDALFNAAKVAHDIPHISEHDVGRLQWLNEFDQTLYEQAINLRSHIAADTDGLDITKIKLRSEFFKPHIDLSNGWVGGGWGPVESYMSSCYTWASSLRPWLGFVADTFSDQYFYARMATYDAARISDLKVTVNGTVLAFDLSPCPGVDGSSFHYVWLKIPRDLIHANGFLKVCFETPRPVNPKRDLGLDDDRDLGLYLNWARLHPSQ